MYVVLEDEPKRQRITSVGVKQRPLTTTSVPPVTGPDRGNTPAVRVGR